MSSGSADSGEEGDDTLEGPMDDRLRNWRPTPAEVDEIVRQHRGLIRELARRDQQRIAVEILRRRHQRSVA